MNERDVKQPLVRCSVEDYENGFKIRDHSHIQSENSMAASYTEIAFRSHCLMEHIENAVNEDDDLTVEGVCSNSIQNEDESGKMNQHEKGRDDRHKFPKRPVSLLCDESFLYDLEGTVRREGDMTHFVAENLEYKIKLSSPVIKRDINQPNISSKNSTPSTSAAPLQRHFLHSQLAPIDSNVLSDIEIDAQYLATSVDNLTENLCNLLHSVSSITADNVEIHKNSVNKLTDNMDSNIKSMYTIMAKTEEISKSMKPTEQLALRIREIKRLVDMLENNL